MKAIRKSKKAKVPRQKRCFWALLCVIFAFFALNAFSQNLESLNDIIRRGSTEEKREALYQIRILATAEASRIAIPALQDANEIVRATAISSVVFLPPAEVTQFLLPLLQDISPLVRQETAYALGKRRNSNAIQPLLEILNHEKELEVKTASVIALGEIGDVSVIDSLLTILQKKPPETEEFLRRSVARTIGQIAQIQQVKDNYGVSPESFWPGKYDSLVNLKYSNLAEKFPSFRQSISVLLIVLQNSKESDDVRREAAFALGSIGDKSVIAILQANLNAKDYYLVEICRESITKLTKGWRDSNQ